MAGGWGEGLLTAEGFAAVEAAGPVEILAGIPALNHARCIAHVLEAVAAGLPGGGAPSVDADRTGPAPDGVERLLEPVLGAEADYVSPAYTRTVTEGTLTTNLLAPMTGALYGRRIQQFIGGCAGLSGGLISRLPGATPRGG